MKASLERFHLNKTALSRVVFLDGVYSEELSAVRPLPKSVALITNSPGESLLLEIPEKIILDEPIHVIFAQTGKKAVADQKLRVLAGSCTRLRLILTHAALTDKSYASNSSAEVRVEAGACVDWDEVHLGLRGATTHKNRFHLKKHSSLNALAFAQGGERYEQETIVDFEDEHAFASLKGLSVLSGKSRILQRATANHLKAHCASRQFYKNILSDDAKSDFDSMVFVDKNAVKSDSRQLNKNLLLSDKAQASTRPQLRIDNDDVSCNHGATVGQMQKDELFYMRSRGISEELARFIMTYGFAEEILEELKPDYLKEKLDQIVKDEITRALK